MSHALHTALPVLVALLSLANLMWPRALANAADLKASDSNHDQILDSGSSLTKRTSAAKAATGNIIIYGTTEAVPLSKTLTLPTTRFCEAVTLSKILNLTTTRFCDAVTSVGRMC
jgi:hypothetical protein